MGEVSVRASSEKILYHMLLSYSRVSFRIIRGLLQIKRGSVRTIQDNLGVRPALRTGRAGGLRQVAEGFRLAAVSLPLG
jgi:hypothetical protein